MRKTPRREMNNGKKTFFDIFLYNKKVNPTVKRGPVFANNVALAIEELRTPQKKQAKCRPKKTPARATSFIELLFKGLGFLITP